MSPAAGRRFGPGLGARLALASVALTGVLLVAYGWMASEEAEATLKEELRAKLASMAALAAMDDKVRALPYAIRDGEVVRAARPRLRKIVDGASIGNLTVLDRDDRVIVDARARYKFHDEDWQLRLDQAELKRVWRGETAASTVYAGEDGGLYLSAYAPLIIDGEVLAVVSAEASAAFLSNVRHLRANLTKVGAIVLALSAVLGLLMAQSITRPLRKLRVAVDRVERGDFTATAAVQAGHEVGELSRAFNRMAQSVNVRHELILENMSNGLVAVDRQGNVAEVNQAAENLLGVRRDEVLGRSFRGCLPSELAQAVEATLEGDEPLHGEKLTVADPGSGSSSLRIFQASTALIRDAEGTARGAEIMFLNVTEMERLTTAFEAQKRFAAIGEVAAEVAHQIRNPLAAIQGFVDLIKPDVPETARSRGFLDDLSKEVRSTEDIVSRFLQYAKPSRLELQPLRVDETVRGLCRSMRNEFDRAGIRLEQQLEAGLPVIRADSKSVEQALANLMRNALEACRKGGFVRIKASATNGSDPGVDIVIEDDGEGLSPEVLPKLFAPFVTTKAKGTGLGLSLAKKFVEAHGGRIALAPLERGTRADVHLPVEPLADDDPAPIAPPLGGVPSGRTDAKGGA